MVDYRDCRLGGVPFGYLSTTHSLVEDTTVQLAPGLTVCPKSIGLDRTQFVSASLHRSCRGSSIWFISLTNEAIYPS